MKRIEVASGAAVTELPGEKFKRCRLLLSMVLPASRSTATALAILPHVLERRCAAIPDAMQLSRYLYTLYGAGISCDSAMVGSNRIITIGLAGLKNEYALEGEDLQAAYLDLLLNLLFAPMLSSQGVFEAEDVSIECAKQADYLRNEMNDKRSYCLRQARRKLYGDSPLGLESGGYLEDIPGVTPQTLHAAYTDLLSRARIEFIVCGVDASLAAQCLGQRLQAVQRSPVAPAPAQPAPTPAQPGHYTEGMDTAQGKLALLFTRPALATPREEAVMRVANAVLGGLPTSRLFMNVREKQSLCYYCGCSYGSFSATLCIDSGIDHEDAARAEQAIMQELHSLQTEVVSDEEMQAAYLALGSAYTAAKDSAGSLVNWTLTEMLRGTNMQVDELNSLVQSVTKEEVREALASFTPAVQYLITPKEVAQ